MPTDFRGSFIPRLTSVAVTHTNQVETVVVTVAILNTSITCSPITSKTMGHPMGHLLRKDAGYEEELSR